MESGWQGSVRAGNGEGPCRKSGETGQPPKAQRRIEMAHISEEDGGWMSQEDAIEEACLIMALAYHSIGDYQKPSDGFCRKCPASRSKGWTFRNDGHIFDYVRVAVLQRLKADGYSICGGFDPETGKELHRN